MYCKVTYGCKKLKTSPLPRGEFSDWKEHLVVSTYAPGDLIIECKKKRRNSPFDKFCGRIIITQKQLNDAPEGRIRAWHSLEGKGRKKENICGRMYVSLIIPKKHDENAHNNITNQNITNGSIEPCNQPIEPCTQSIITPVYNTIVVDRLAELKPGLNIKKTNNTQAISPEEFCKRTESFEKLIKNMDDQLKSLEFKFTMFQNGGTSEYLKLDIERIMEDIEGTLEFGTKRIKQMGSELNAVKDEDLSLMMKSFNVTLAKFMSRTNEFHKIKEEIQRVAISD